MAEKILLITVGTSLHRSASWRHDNTPLSTIKGYSRWISKYLENPSGRSVMAEGENCSEKGEFVAAEIKRLLEVDNAEEWAKFLAVDTAHPLRYSAELTTLLKLREKEGGAFKDLSAYLRHNFDKIVFLTDEDSEDSGHIVAFHLAAYLRVLAPDLGGIVEVNPAISGAHLQDKIVSLAALLKRYRDERKPVDLLLSGGFKLFAMIGAGFIPQTDWTGYYLQEEDSQIVELTKDFIKAGNSPRQKINWGVSGGAVGE